MNQALHLADRIMATETDEHFYERADAHIHLANDHLKGVDRGKVSASFLYAAARFNVHIAACSRDSRERFASERAGIRDYYVAQYTRMLEEHLDDYLRNFDRYMSKVPR